MKTWAKILFAVLGTTIFFVAGATACTYTPAAGINMILVGVLGTLVFLTAGGALCVINEGKTAKVKGDQKRI